MDTMKDRDILLESGTNELEVIEFTLGGQNFGINVAKVEEILRFNNEVTPMPHSNRYVEGVFRQRGTIITIINLAYYLGLPESDNRENDILIVTNFNNQKSAFHVHTVRDIHRISWQDIEKPDPTIYGGDAGVATGIVRYNDHLITIVDFEKIITDISPKSSIQIEEIEVMGDRRHSKKPLLLVEDSPMLEKLITKSLVKAGYENVITCSNGEEAWNRLQNYKKAPGDITEHVALIITDIEMPRMDGHHLIKLVREDRDLRYLPIIIFSSLINEEMYNKGKMLGATEQITKPEIGKLVRLIDIHLA
ncbi:MAG: chemotaxis protein [Clostridiales bacterium]|jgi:two-component system chemotaxis response regulator CheV|nr:chemotaxis protein [Clostridiales bacterium]